jgi:LuxR family maltose regulon positive regulatory protein
LNILGNLDESGESKPDGENGKDVNLLLLENIFIPVLLAGTGRYDEAERRSFDAIMKWGKSDKPFAGYLLCTAYSNLAYINLYTCTATHRYDFAEYLKKMVEYLKVSPEPPVKMSKAYAVADIRSFSCLVGEGADLAELELFLEKVRQFALYTGETYYNRYYGYDDLVACDIAFFKNQPNTARRYAQQAVVKAREKKQYSIEAISTGYLLRIAMCDGDYPLAKELLRQLGGHLDNPDFWSRQLIYDVITGFFYAQIGLVDRVPSWLVMNERDINSEVHFSVRELMICAKSYIALKKYNHALTVLVNAYPRKPEDRFLFGELTLTLLTAVARIKTGDTGGAVADFEKAYSLSLDGVLEQPFIELRKDLHPLIAAVKKFGKAEFNQNNRLNSALPNLEWLTAIGRKAFAYSKKVDAVAAAFKREQKIEEPVKLSEREREILTDIYHGLSREAIAASRYLSINTVKTILQSIYLKLDADNNVDAVRIAIEKKLVD